MNKVTSFALAVLPVLVGIWLASVLPNPVALLKPKA